VGRVRGIIVNKATPDPEVRELRIIDARVGEDCRKFNSDFNLKK
jgi:hypothetical protein